MLTALHVSPGAPANSPDAALGRRQTRHLCARAQSRIRPSVRGGLLCVIDLERVIPAGPG
jgi:hypothetical protein